MFSFGFFGFLNRFKTNILGDITGGITAAVVALPLALAFGISSGAGPVAGLYGAIIVGVVAAIFGGTACQISGPTGPMTVVMTSVILQFSVLYPEDGLMFAFTTVFLGGCLQVLLGFLRLGRYIIMVPYPVISGFMSGIGVIIILLELAPLLGFPAAKELMSAVQALPIQIANPNPYSLFIGGVTLAIVFGWRGKLNQLVPSPLLALGVTGILTVWFLPANSLSQIGEIPSALPSIHFPSFRLDLVRPMFMYAVMLALLGSIDSLLTSLVAENISGEPHDSDKELIGQGLGNALAGLCGGLPGAGATMRTMVNLRAGGRGPLSGVTHSVVLLAVVLGLGFIFESIPLAALAGVLLKVGFDIIDWPFLKRVRVLPMFSVALMLLVLVLTVFVDLITAVLVGVFIKNIVTIVRLTDFELGSVVLSDGQQQQDRLYESERRFLQQHAGQAVLLRIDGPISYAARRGLNMMFEQFKRPGKYLVVDFSRAALIGVSTTLVIEGFIQHALSQGVEVKIIMGTAELQELLKSMGVERLVGKDNCYKYLDEALNGMGAVSG